MKKIRINELARQLEVPSHQILEMLPELGVTEKKTHSSSVDDDVAEAIRRKLGLDGAGEGDNGAHADIDYSAAAEHAPAEGPAAPAEAAAAESTPAVTPATTAAPPPHTTAAPEVAAAESSTLEQPAAEAAPQETAPRKAAPLRPPLAAGSPLTPPLRTGGPGGHAPIQAKPVPTAPAAPRPGQILSGPRQPLPAMPTSVPPGAPTAPARPAPQPTPGPTPPASVIAPGAPRPGAPMIPRPPARPTPQAPAQAETGGGPQPNMPLRQQMRPGAPQPSARPPAGSPAARPLAGQPAARPVVPPRPDMVARLQQAAKNVPAAPRPGMPQQRPATPLPGQPIYRGPIRPGQPVMRGPALPGQAPGGLRRGRPMHPTTPRVEPAAPPPTDTGRRHATKPGTRPAERTRKDEEGKLRPVISRREHAAPPPPIDREITVSEGITVKELSEKLGVKAKDLIQKLLERKIFATINQTLDAKTSEDIARMFGASTNKVSYEEEATQEIESVAVDRDMVKRPPVITVMGHVDHGKTSLLDAIRSANVAEREAGGITQHIGAYTIELGGRKLVFIDTPGHEAFTRMRARGAKVTDLVVLVVAADDGVMPQTIEAIDHARAAKVPIVVAINKIDKPDAQPERIKQQLADRGLLAEDWGGDVVMVPVSARTHEHIDELLEMILLVADLQDLKANPERPAVANVLEAKLDRGRGPVATVLVRNGTLHVGDHFICGSVFGRVRAMFDDRGNPAKDAGPSTPVEVLGLESLPEVGDTFQAVTDTAKAKQIVIYRESKAREAAMSRSSRVTLEQLHERLKEGEQKELNIILKTDVGGTAEVLSDMMQKLSNEKVKIRVMRAAVGAINESDVLLASTSEAIIVGFNVRPERNAAELAEKEGVDIRLHTIIYELTDEIKKAMTGMLEPVFKEVYRGRVSVREVFHISKVGNVAGCMVLDGAITRGSQIRVLRDNVVVHTGKIESLRRFKDDVSEVKSGYECGIVLHNFSDLKPGDVIEAFATERVAAEALV